MIAAAEAVQRLADAEAEAEAAAAAGEAVELGVEEGELGGVGIGGLGAVGL